MKHSILFKIAAFILFSSTALHSQWTRTGGPGGGFVSDMASNTSYLFAGSTNGVFRSADEGLHWERMENGLPFSFLCYQLKAQDENLILFGYNYMEDHIVSSDYDVYKSADNGDSWKEINLPDSVHFPREIAIRDDMIFVADNSLLRSTDNGQTWEYVLTGVDSFYNSASALEIYEGRLYVVANYKMWVTSDWGSTWDIVWFPGGFNAHNIYTKDSLLTVVGDDDAYRSTDYGQTWEKAKGWENSNSHWKDIIHLNDTIYASSSNLLRSMDWGLNWEAVSPSSTSYHVNGVTTDDKHVFAFSYSEGLKKFNPASESYQALNLGIDATQASCLSIHDNELWAGVNYNGLYKYNIADKSWDTTNYFPVPFEFNDIVWVGDWLFAIHSFGSVYRSGEGGLSWLDITPGGSANFSKFLVDGNTIFLFGEYNNVALRSDDFGLTWKNPFPTFYGQTHSSANRFIPIGSQYFVSSNDKVFRSSDGGVTWEDKTAGIETGNGFICDILAAGNILYVGVSIQDMTTYNYHVTLYRSNDQGENWDVSLTGLPEITTYGFGDEAALTMVAFHDTIILGTRSDGIFYSTITDPAWHPWMVQDLFPSSIASLMLNGNQLYAGTFGMGVWQREVTNIGTGLNPLQKQVIPLILFPNPVDSKLTIGPLSQQHEAGSIFIYTTEGRLAFYKKTFVDQPLTVDVSKLSAGEYVIQVEVSEQLHSGKFLKVND